MYVCVCVCVEFLNTQRVLSKSIAACSAKKHRRPTSYKHTTYKGTYDPVVPLFYGRFHPESHLSPETGQTTQKTLTAHMTQ